MTRPAPSPADPNRTGPTSTGTARYQIRVAGHLDDHWAASLGDLVLVRLDDDTTSLTGPVVDQAQLHGVLARIRDLGVPLLSLRTLDPAGTAAGGEAASHPGSEGAGGCTAAPRLQGSAPPTRSS